MYFSHQIIGVEVLTAPRHNEEYIRTYFKADTRAACLNCPIMPSTGRQTRVPLLCAYYWFFSNTIIYGFCFLVNMWTWYNHIIANLNICFGKCILLKTLFQNWEFLHFNCMMICSSLGLCAFIRSIIFFSRQMQKNVFLKVYAEIGFGK